MLSYSDPKALIFLQIFQRIETIAGMKYKLLKEFTFERVAVSSTRENTRVNHTKT